MSTSDPALLKPGIFYGWFVVAAAFTVSFVGFGCAYSFSAFVEPLQRDSKPRAVRSLSYSRWPAFFISASGS